MRQVWTSRVDKSLQGSPTGKLILTSYRLRIEEAEQAMRQALRSAVEYEDSDQRHTIGEALRHLETVQQSLRDAGQSGATPSERQRCLAKGSFHGRRELSLYAASQQFPIYGADNGVAAACIAAKSL